MLSDNGQILSNYVLLSLKERFTNKRNDFNELSPLKKKIIQNNCVTPIQSAANDVYALFIKKKIARNRKWIDHDQYMEWLYEVKDFLLEPDLLCVPELSFLELIEEVNTFIV